MVTLFGSLAFAAICVVMLVVHARYSGLVEKLDSKRAHFLRQAAEDIGWEFQPDPDDDVFSRRLLASAAFGRGEEGRSFNQMRGGLRVRLRDGSRKKFEALAGDFTCKVKVGRDKPEDAKFSYVVVRLPNSGADELHLRLEGPEDRVAAAVGLNDIDFESVEFSNRFFVEASRRRFAYDVIHPQMMEFLLASPVSQIDISAGLLCVTSQPRRLERNDRRLPHADAAKPSSWVYLLDHRWKKEQFPEMIRLTAEFLSLWPRHLLTDPSN